MAELCGAVVFFFFFQAEDGIRDKLVTGVQTCALPISSWLNQVEGFFGILGKQSLFLTDFKSKKALCDHLRAYMKGWNRNPTPFEWTKPAKAIIRSHRRMLDRISTAVH